MKPQFIATEALLPPVMAQKLEEVGVTKVNRVGLTTFLLAVTGGMFIALAFVFYTTVMIGAEALPFGLTKLAGGLVFSLGLVLVIICGGELFTSSVLCAVAKASNRISWRQLWCNWTLVYLGNMLGALTLVVLIWLAKLHWTAEGSWGINAMKIAQHKLSYGFFQAMTLGLLCNLMVCLAVWMTFSCRSVSDKIAVLLLPISMFVACGFEHSIANLFMIPMGIMIQHFASDGFWALTPYSASDFSSLNLENFITANLLPVTFGNILGGLMVSAIYWFCYRRQAIS
ncbi:formate transporter FocA [uncultured Shewanella sp.]|uniref:formate transporter FocA n=1 Tax=uncultured Shewanella sp. TaxID=173975 RepID=UPI00261359CE|nr:formate transporter FocA [uncultured Shewanella sp.]